MKISNSFLSKNISLLSFGFLFSLFSSFGQTFFVSLFVPFLQKDFNLSDSLFSSIYGVATIASAFTIVWLGRYIDKLRLTKFSVRILIMFSLSLLLFSQAYHAIMLFLAIYGIRLFGQGLMTHTSITSMARFFTTNRGKAISIASLGHPAGEAILPIIIVSSIAFFGWRTTFLLCAAILLLLIPLTLFLLKSNKSYSKLRLFIPAKITTEEKQNAKSYNLIKNKFFWILAPSGIASGAIGTGFLFFQLNLGQIKSWSPEFIALAFSAYAIGSAIFTIVGGYLTDRWSAKKLLPFTLLPFFIGVLTLLLFDGKWVYVVFISGIGITNGFTNPVKNTAMAELFGTKLLGSVRSLFTTVGVFATALGPLIFGVLFDFGFNFNDIALFSLIIFVLAALNSLRILKYA